MQAIPGLFLASAVGLVACSGSPAQGLQSAPGPTLLEGLAPDQSELDLRTTPVVRAVQRASDSVISVYVLDARARDLEHGTEGQGSAVIVDAEGLAITNWHVVAQALANPAAFRVKVRLKDGRVFDARPLSSSPHHDLALLQLDLPAGERVTPVSAGRSNSLMIGETVIAIGNPTGHANTVTVGVLSAIDRSIKVRTPDGMVRSYAGLLQTDAAINRGNSGGALLDITGKLIGINNAMAVGVENIGFAIPVDTVKEVFEDVLLSSENLASVWIGLDVQDHEGDPIVAAVAPYGPAAREGVEPGDRVESVAGVPVHDRLDFARALVKVRPGTTVPLAIRRGQRTLEVRPRALSNVEREIALRTGIEVTSITARDDIELLRTATRAFYANSRMARVPLLPVVLRITSIYPESPAAELGLEPGDAVMGTRGYDWMGYARDVALRSLEDFADRVRDATGSAIEIVVLRDGEYRYGELDVRRL